MIEMLILMTWLVGAILAVMWLFLPWIIISKLDAVIEELKEMNRQRGSVE